MDGQLIVTLIIIFALIELLILILYVKYKQGKIDENPFVSILVKEWKILYYSIFRWKRKNSFDHGTAVFPIHENSMYFWFFLALMHEQVIELVILHIYIKSTSPTLAYIITALHLYSILYIMGDYNWTRNSPVVVSGNKVEIKIGARRQLSFYIKDIETIQRSEIEYDKSGAIIFQKGIFHVTVLPRVITRVFGISDELKYEITFCHPIEVKGYFGLKRKVTKAFLYFKQSDDFVNLLEEKMQDAEEITAHVDQQLLTKTEPFINWKLFSLLLIINIVGAFALAPYAVARNTINQEMEISLVAFIAIFIVQVVLEAALLIILTLRMARKVTIKLPILQWIITKQNDVSFPYKRLIGSASLGIVTGGMILIVSYFISKSLGIADIDEPSWWLGILGSLGAGITEETIFRFFLITFVIWCLTKIKKFRRNQTLTNWVAVISAALMFGLLHYGIASSSIEMTIGVFFAMLLINGIGGIAFGAIFIYLGLEFSMIAHFSADLVIHVLAPLFLS